MRVLLVEPDNVWAASISAALAAESVRVDVVATLYAAVAAAAYHPCDVIVTALALPDGSGLDLCRMLEDAGVRRIVVSPSGAPEDRVAALEAGADDVVSRDDLSLRELALRVRAVGRRGPLTPTPPPASVPPPRPGAFGPLAFDDGGEVRVQGELVELSATERAVLAALVARPGRVLERTALLEQVWGSTEIRERTVDSVVKRLRARLGRAGGLIETVRGVGYRIKV